MDDLPWLIAGAATVAAAWASWIAIRASRRAREQRAAESERSATDRALAASAHVPRADNFAPT